MPENLFDPNALADINISLSGALIGMFLSLGSAILIRYLYLKFGRSLNNREYFGNIFLLLSVTTCTVIIIVKYSLALSLGLVGALSIVRFRAAIKEPEELVYLFLVIALGLAFGANQFFIGLILLGIASLTIILSGVIFTKRNTFDHTGMVIILSGEKSLIKELRKKELEELLQTNLYTLLKEIEYTATEGRIVLKASSDNQSAELINSIEDMADGNIQVNIISDVSVPA
jgi:hypothetical protein